MCCPAPARIFHVWSRSHLQHQVCVCPCVCVCVCPFVCVCVCVCVQMVLIIGLAHALVVFRVIAAVQLTEYLGDNASIAALMMGAVLHYFTITIMTRVQLTPTFCVCVCVYKREIMGVCV